MSWQLVSLTSRLQLSRGMLIYPSYLHRRAHCLVCDCYSPTKIRNYLTMMITVIVEWIMMMMTMMMMMIIGEPRQNFWEGQFPSSASFSYPPLPFLPTHSLPFPSPPSPPSPSFPSFKSRPLKFSCGYGERCKLPSGVLGRNPSGKRIWCILH